MSKSELSCFFVTVVAALPSFPELSVMLAVMPTGPSGRPGTSKFVALYTPPVIPWQTW